VWKNGITKTVFAKSIRGLVPIWVEHHYNEKNALQQTSTRNFASESEHRV
jgi:hypothetical protein